MAKKPAARKRTVKPRRPSPKRRAKPRRPASGDPADALAPIGTYPDVPDWVKNRPCPHKAKYLSGCRVLPEPITGRGKLADLVMVEGNPLEDIELLLKRDSICLVMQGGKIVSRNDSQ